MFVNINLYSDFVSMIKFKRDLLVWFVRELTQPISRFNEVPKDSLAYEIYLSNFFRKLGILSFDLSFLPDFKDYFGLRVGGL